MADDPGARDRYRRLADVFLAVCHLNRDERRRELDARCGADADLRAEVEILLAFHDRRTRTRATAR